MATPPMCYNYIEKGGYILADSPLIKKSKEFALKIIKRNWIAFAWWIIVRLWHCFSLKVQREF